MKTPQGQHSLTDANVLTLINNVVLVSPYTKKELVDEYFSLRESGYAEGAIYLFVPKYFGVDPVLDLRKRNYSELYA